MKEIPFADPTRITVPELIQLAGPAREISLRTQQPQAQQSGTYVSGFKGRGMEFDEVRPYQLGDDMRHLDWKVTARTGQTYTKLFREERERPVLLWVDLRPGMFFATRGLFKSVVAAQTAGLLAWSAGAANDRVGGLVFSADSHEELKPGRGKAAVLHFLKRLHAGFESSELTASTAADPGKHALSRLRRVAKPGSLIFLISDFRGLVDSAQRELARLTQHNDVMLIFIYDPLEKALPPPGRYRVGDDSRVLDLDTGNKTAVQRYTERFIEHQRGLHRISLSLGLRWLEISTDTSPATVLRRRLNRAR